MPSLRLGGLWRVIGDEHYINFAMDCDKNATIYAKTAYYVHNPTIAKGFKAENGVAQGDSTSSTNYKLIEDILLDFLVLNHERSDTYRYTDATGVRRYQKPSLFMDDLNTFHASVEGAQHTIHKLELLGKVFNIHLNPKKCKHLRAVWTANPAKHPKNPSLKVLQGNPADSELFYRQEGSAEALGIPIVPHHESMRILGAQITTGTTQDSIASALATKTRAITSGMTTKKLTLQETTKVLHTAVFPAIAYPAKFTALNQRQYEAISSPARQLVRTNGHYKLHHNAAVFNNDATSYGESHKDLNDYIQEDVRRRPCCTRCGKGPDGKNSSSVRSIHGNTFLLCSRDTPH